MIDYMTFIHRPWYKRLWAWIKGLFGYPKAAIIYMTKNRHAEVNCEETWCDGCKRFSKGPYCPNCR